MRGACAADDPWQDYRQKFRVFFREPIGQCAARQMPAGGSGWNATNTLLTVLPSQACPGRHRGISSSVLCLPSNFFRSKR